MEQHLIDVRVVRKNMEAEGIASFELALAGGGALPDFEPGAHIDVHLPGGLVRQYSLYGPPGEIHYRIAVLRDPASRGGSQAMHVHVHEGDTIRISSPRNHFPLHPGTPHSLLLGGGIGITPVLCMAEQLSRQNASFELHYCTRSPERTAFHDALRRNTFAQRVRFHFDDGPAEQKLDIGAQLRACPPNTHLYVCGPKGFMDAVLDKACELGWPESRLHFEYFAGEVVRKADDGVFEVEIASSGLVVPVQPHQSIAQALAVAGIDVPQSCEQGVCGTCLTRVLSGAPDHRDMYLSPDEQAGNDQILVCCSRSRSPRLVLDL